MFVLFLVAALVPTMIVGHGVFPCTGGHPTPTALTIAGCEASPCDVQQGAPMTYTVNFVPNAASAGMTLSIESTVLGETRDVPLPPALSNACNGMNPPCPVAAGQAVSQSATIPVFSDYHGGIHADLRVEMTNAQGVTNMCAMIYLIIH